MGGQRQRRHLGQLHHPTLGRAVARNGGDGDLRVDRRHVDDRAFDPPLHHRPRGALRRHEDARQVQVDDAREILQRQGQEVARHRDARIVDQRVDRPDLRLHPVEERADGRRIAHVADIAGAAELCGSGVHVVLDVHEHDAAAVLPERLGAGVADALRGSGDERDAIHVVPPPDLAKACAARAGRSTWA